MKDIIENQNNMESNKEDTNKNSFLNSYINTSKDVFYNNIDLIGHLMIWDNIDNVSANEWRDFWNNVKSTGIKLRKGEIDYKDKEVNIFEKYSICKLKELYENERIYDVTQYFINCLSKKGYSNYKLISENNDYSSYIFRLKTKNTHSKIQLKQFRTKKEHTTLKIKMSACGYIYYLLTEKDNINSELYDFVINNLQYAQIEDLKKLIKLSQNGFIIKNKGRKSLNKKIFKFDLEHHLLNTYQNRNECIDAEQISKQALYNVLSGKRKQLKGFIYEEEK